jgi:hypothetical protein
MMMPLNVSRMALIAFLTVLLFAAALLSCPAVTAREGAGLGAGSAAFDTVADEGGGSGEGPHHDEGAGHDKEENSPDLPHVHSETGAGHSHAHKEGEKDDECMTCQEYWHEPWRISEQSLVWVKAKTFKIFIFVLICYLYLKRKALLSLFSGRKGSGRQS